MLKECQLVSIFCEIDDFCKELDKNMPQPLLTNPTKSRRGPVCCLSVSEIMTIHYSKWLDIEILKRFTPDFYRFIGNSIFRHCPATSDLLS